MMTQHDLNSTSPRRVLVTGATGAIGIPVCQHLIKRGHFVRGLGRKEEPDLGDVTLDEYVRGDLTDRTLIDSAVAGMDTILHLGAYRNDADFVNVLLAPNVIGVHYICEAAQKHGVQRLMLASTLQTVAGFGQADEPIHISDGPRPTNHYALTKVWGEIYGDMMVRNHNLSVINVRIGWLPRDPEYAQRLFNSDDGVNIYLSHNDAQRFFERCVESETPGPGQSVTLFATSKPLHRTRLDLESARVAIGYIPQNSWPEGLPFDPGL